MTGEHTAGIFSGALEKPPSAVRIEACSICQLHCPMCQLIANSTNTIGHGNLTFKLFSNFIIRNPAIKSMELGNFGEVFLNPELPEILEFAHAHGIITEIDEGANLNHASDDVLDALVRFGTSRVRCAIDGVTQSVYERYRVGGSLRNVIKNISRINELKKKYSSSTPHLVFQFIIFGYNINQIEQAALLAKMLKMKIEYKLDCLAGETKDEMAEKVRELTGYSDRNEYLDRKKVHYMRHLCYQMWHTPQINWDGKLLGCSRNIWGEYARNVFEENYFEQLNNDKMLYARKMLMGLLPKSDDIPCSKCSVFESMQKFENWLSPDELKMKYAVDQFIPLVRNSAIAKSL